jgi:hypothetical protein
MYLVMTSPKLEEMGGAWFLGRSLLQAITDTAREESETLESNRTAERVRMEPGYVRSVADDKRRTRSLVLVGRPGLLQLLDDRDRDAPAVDRLPRERGFVLVLQVGALVPPKDLAVHGGVGRPNPLVLRR